MQTEYDSLIENETWEITPLPENRQVITSRWCFKLKKDRDSRVLKYKARWIAHGFNLADHLPHKNTQTFSDV